MKAKTRNILLISSGLGIIIVLALVLRKQTALNNKGKSLKQNKVKMIPDFDLFPVYDNNGKTVIATLPKAKYGRYDVIIVWGGMRYATPKWMMEQMPKELFYTHIVVLADYRLNWNVLKPIYDGFMKSKHLSNVVNSTSIAGFSAGGYDVYDNYNQNYRVVGLIDPSTRSSYSKLPFTSNTKMVYNDRNWGSYQSIKNALPLVANAINEKGGFAEKVSISHKEIPKYFFNKFKNDF